MPEKITIVKSGANTAAIKTIPRPMLGFKTFQPAQITIAGIETMHMIFKGKFDCPVA